MTKDEFLSMVNDEVERLEEERTTLGKQVDRLYRENPEGKEYKEAEYRLRIAQEKFTSIFRLVSLPIYARIQAMSDAEIEEYKQGKLGELELKIQEIESRDQQEREELSQLKAEQAQLIEQLGSLSGGERDRVILRSQQLSEEIGRYEADNLWSVFVRNDKERKVLRQQQEQVQAMTSQDVKQQLSSELKENQYLTKTAGKEFPADEFTQLQATVASDPEKAQQMADLLARYHKFSHAQKEVKCKMPQWLSLPKLLQNRLMRCYDSTTGEVRDPNKFMEIVEEYEGSFQHAKTSFMEQCTAEKLSQLVGKETGNDVEVDMGFLQQHTDKLGNGDFTFLQSLVEQRNQLSKKVIKTRSTKESIESLNNQIKLQQSTMCKQIIGWYQSQSSALLGMSGLRFDNLEWLRQSLEDCQRQIGASESQISTIKEEFQKAKAQMEQQKNDYEMGKQEVTQQIRGLGGEKYQDTQISGRVMGDSADNLKDIVNSSATVYTQDLIHNVQQEAQKQADTREAELRNMTIEELLQMKQQVQAMADEPLMMGAVNEDISHGVTR